MRKRQRKKILIGTLFSIAFLLFLLALQTDMPLFLTGFTSVDADLYIDKETTSQIAVFSQGINNMKLQHLLNGVKISWSLYVDEQVSFSIGETDKYEIGEYVAKHSISFPTKETFSSKFFNVPILKPGTLYYFKIKTSLGSYESVFKTLGEIPAHCFNSIMDVNELGIDCGGDCLPCVKDVHFLNIKTRVLPQQVTVSWETDKPVNAQFFLESENKEDYETQASEAITLPLKTFAGSTNTYSLEPNTTYKFKIIAGDASYSSVFTTYGYATTENHCENTVQDYDEEGTDCGGIDCDPCPTITECVDSDNGLLPNVYGYVTFGENVYYDECQDESIIIEYYCEDNKADYKLMDCSEGYSCEAGVCTYTITECVELWVCGAWNECDPVTLTQTRTCEDQNNCSTEENKPDEEADCTITQQAECEDDEDCEIGYICDLETNTCVLAPECTTDGDCNTGYICIEGECIEQECEEDTDCEENEYCDEGVCTALPECYDSIDNDDDGYCDFDGCIINGTELDPDPDCDDYDDDSEAEDTAGEGEGEGEEDHGWYYAYECNNAEDDDNDGYCDYEGCCEGYTGISSEAACNGTWLEPDPGCENRYDHDESDDVVISTPTPTETIYEIEISNFAYDYKKTEKMELRLSTYVDGKLYDADTFTVVIQDLSGNDLEILEPTSIGLGQYSLTYHMNKLSIGSYNLLFEALFDDEGIATETRNLKISKEKIEEPTPEPTKAISRGTALVLITVLFLMYIGTLGGTYYFMRKKGRV